MESRTAARGIALCLLLLPALPAAAQTAGLQLPRITAEPRCRETPADGDEIVVCGESPENSPYRIPREFRNRESFDDRDASWDTRFRDEQSLQAFGDQHSGPSAFLLRSRQQDCQWRAARQEAQGRRPDCGKRSRPDEATDWQRGR